MTRRFSVSMTLSAVGDLEEVRDYYRKKQIPEVAEKLLAGIFAAIEELHYFTDRGRVVPEFGQSNLREVIHPPFRIVYRRDTDRVQVVRVWRSERLLRLP